MSENPYQSGRTPTSAPEKTRATRWLLWPGIAMLVSAAVSLGIGVVGIIKTFSGVAASTTSQPDPAELAQGISAASVWLGAMLPLAVLGIVLLVAGFLIRQPVDRTSGN